MIEDLPTRRYRFGPRDRRGLLAGISASQAVVVVVSLAFAVSIVHSSKSRLGPFAALGVVCVGIGAVTWPIRGRSIHQWVPIALGFAGTTAAKGRRRSVLETVRRPDRGALLDCDLQAFERDGRPIGVLVDRQRKCASAVLGLVGQPFALLDEESRRQASDRWSAVLSALAERSGPLVQLSWIERTVPEQPVALYDATELAFQVPGGAQLSRARASYLELLASESNRSIRHESVLVVTARELRGPHGIGELIDAVADRCRDAGVETSGALSPGALRTFVQRTTAAGPSFESGGALPALSFVEGWSSIRSEGTYHAIYWVAEWPRSDVGSDFLLPLLLLGGVRRTSVVAMRPRPPGRAVREAERARTESESDADLRRRHGFALSARTVREHDAVARREAEIAAGHAAYRFNGVIAVTATSQEQLERDCARVEQGAASARLSLRRLYGSQREAFAVIFPIGRAM